MWLFSTETPSAFTLFILQVGWEERSETQHELASCKLARVKFKFQGQVWRKNGFSNEYFCFIISALKCLIWTPPIAQYPSLILSDCVLICGLIMRSYLGPLMYSRPCASSPTRCFNTPGTLQAIKGGSNRLTQVLGQYCCFCY